MTSFPLAILLATRIISCVFADSSYGPIVSKCPLTPLVRDASEGIAKLEDAYLYGRKPKADQALADWLKKTNPDFNTTKLPTVALAHSGGGYRAMLSGAGLVKGFDSRDSDVSTSGLLQGMTYQAGLSGGGWLLSGLIGNNYPTISSIVKDYWKETLDDTALVPDSLFESARVYEQIEDDFDAKKEAGFETTMVDLYGRLLAYQFLPGERMDATMWDVIECSNFRSYDMPFPIITALGPTNPGDECVPNNSTPSYEFTPYEFGSWDAGVSAFTQTQFLGTNYTNGGPFEKGTCITNYDKLGYILGTSSNIFNLLCADYNLELATEPLSKTFYELVDRADGEYVGDEYAIYRNPFHKWETSSLVNNQKSLFLVDGGENGQTIPLNPLLQPARNIDVIIIGDNSADVDNFPNGAALAATYEQSLSNGLTRMPSIPSTDIFVNEGLNKHPTFFGCHDKEKVTLVYLPNMKYTTDSNKPTSKLEYEPEETDAMIENGVQIATMGGDEGWAECLGCALMEKMGGGLPEACEACWEAFCYEG